MTSDSEPRTTLAGRDKQVYFAKLAEQSKLYDAIIEYLEELGELDDELSVEERNLLSVPYKNAVGNRLAARRIIASAEQREKIEGNDDNAAWAREYCTKVEGELQKICSAIFELLDQSLIPKASNAESEWFYKMMKAELSGRLRYMEEVDKPNSAVHEEAPRAGGTRSGGPLGCA